MVEEEQKEERDLVNS
jgi:hypothetical protein